MLSAVTAQKLIQSLNYNQIFNQQRSLVTIASSDIFNSYDYYLAITYGGFKNLNIMTSGTINSYYIFGTIKSITFSRINWTPQIINFSKMFPNIETVGFDEDVNYISTVFANSSLNTVYLRNSVRIINYCFYGCKNLTNFDTSKARYIGDHAFANSGLSGKITFSNQVEICNNAFINTHIEEVIIAKDAHVIIKLNRYEERIIELTRSMPIETSPTVIEMSESPRFYPNVDRTTLGKIIFSGCNELKKISINSSYFMDLSIFAGAYNISEVEIDNELDLSYNHPLLYNKAHSIIYSCLPINSQKEIIIPESVDTIKYGFQYCINIEKITFQSKKIHEFGEGLFLGCSNLKEVIYSSDIIFIKPGCFINCSKLHKIELPYVNFIPEYCFAGCASLTEISIGQKSTFIRLDITCFMNCTSLESISFNDKLNSIPIYCFAYSGLKRFTITNKITKIESNAFIGCNDLVITISEDHPVYYVTETEIIMKNSNVLISIYNNNLSSSVIFSNSVQDIDGEYLEDIIYSKTKLIILPESLDNSFNNEFFRNWWEQSNFYGIRYETSFCKEGYKSISFWDFGEDRPLAVKATSIEAPIIYREDPFDDIEISLPKLFANNFYNYAEEEFYLQAIKGECSIIEENITYNETNESSCDVNDNSFSLNGETVYKQSGKYKAELAALIIFIILCVIAISVIIYYQILLHKSTENVDNHN